MSGDFPAPRPEDRQEPIPAALPVAPPPAAPTYPTQPPGMVVYTAPTTRKKSPLRFILLGLGLIIVLVVGGIGLQYWQSRNDNKAISQSTVNDAGKQVVTSQGMTVTLPAGWVNVPTTPAKMQKFLATAAAKDPKLKALLDKNLSNMAVIRKLAIFAVRRTAVGYGANFNAILVNSSPNIDDIAPQVRLQLHSVGATDIQVAKTTMAGYPAVVVTYTITAPSLPSAEHGAQAYVHSGSSTPILTVTSPVSTADARASLERIGQTLQLQ